MRKRKYLIGLTLALAASVAVSGIAQGAVTSQQLIVSVAKSKQDRKVRGPADINVTVNTTETPPTPVNQTAAQTVLTFPGDFDLGNTAQYPECDPATLANTTTAQALALCAPSQVGAGDSTVCSATGGCGVTSLPGVVTAFNGVPSGGNPTIILHNRIGPPANATTVLTGVLTGTTLTVTVPDTAATGLHLTHFFTGVPVRKTGTTGAAASTSAKKKKKKPVYYITARCSTRTWAFSETTMFRGGAPSQSASTSIPCTQKKAKKKKK